MNKIIIKAIMNTSRLNIYIKNPNDENKSKI